MRVWGCPYEVRSYNPHEKEVNPMTISDFLIGYAQYSKGYRFYYPSHTTRTVELRNAKFLKDDSFSGSDRFKDLVPSFDNTASQLSTSSSGVVLIRSALSIPPADIPPTVEIPRAVPSYYVSYLQESNIGVESDLEIFSQKLCIVGLMV